MAYFLYSAEIVVFQILSEIDFFTYFLDLSLSNIVFVNIISVFSRLERKADKKMCDDLSPWEQDAIAALEATFEQVARRRDIEAQQSLMKLEKG